MSYFQALIIADSGTLSRTMLNVLVRLGCRATVVPTTQTARAELSRRHYHIVFAELCAPEEGGRSIARWVKEQCLDTKCLILTSWRGEVEQGLFAHDGIHGLIRKPLVFNDIRDELLKCIG
jgi:DNA-binding NtrC family response regulator